MEHIKVGMFNLPGIKFAKGQLPEDLLLEMDAWSKENKCGYMMNDWLWSFKTEAQRDWFVLRWNDSIPKEVEKPVASPPAVIKASKRKPRTKKTP